MKTKICEIEVNNIWYHYAVAALWISIHTAPREKQYADLPEHTKIQTMVETPNCLVGLTPTNSEVRRAVEKIIRAKVDEQRRRAEGRL